ncbi:MAG TPA: type IV secretion system protein [Steroidobacteraceae bacterium]|nr:type IV secretion system protein [Steroidobacteraceae bacterium]
MSAEAELRAYWREGASWEADRAALCEEVGRIWRWVAAAGWLGVVLLAAALAVLMPLKRVEPFVIRVDDSTGIVDVVPEYAGRGGAGELVTRYLLTHYVRVCQRFNLATAHSDYEECGAFHTPALNQQWYARWKRSNPASPLNLYRDGTTVQAEVSSVSFFHESTAAAGLAQVRYITRTRPGGDGAEQVAHWVAQVQYAYGTPAHDPRLRVLNPLGLRVVSFSSEQEAQEPPPSIAPSSMPPAAPAAAPGRRSP